MISNTCEPNTIYIWGCRDFFFMQIRVTEQIRFLQTWKIQPYIVSAKALWGQVGQGLSLPIGKTTHAIITIGCMYGMIVFTYMLLISTVNLGRYTVRPINPMDCSLPDVSFTWPEMGKIVSKDRGDECIQLKPDTQLCNSPLLLPIGSMGLVYLPTWMVDFYGKCR